MNGEPLIPDLQSVTLAAANTEYSIAIPKNTRYVSIKCRQAVEIRWAPVTGKVDTPTEPYATISSGSAENSPEGFVVSPDWSTLYLGTGDASSPVAEIRFWVVDRGA